MKAVSKIYKLSFLSPVRDNNGSNLSIDRKHVLIFSYKFNSSKLEAVSSM